MHAQGLREKVDGDAQNKSNEESAVGREIDREHQQKVDIEVGVDEPGELDVVQDEDLHQHQQGEANHVCQEVSIHLPIPVSSYPRLASFRFE